MGVTLVSLVAVKAFACLNLRAGSERKQKHKPECEKNHRDCLLLR